MRLAPWLMLTLPLISLTEFGMHRWMHRAGPTVNDWQRLRTEIVAVYRPHDLVTSAPKWSNPLLRQVLGDELMPIDTLARADDETLGRVIEVSFGGKRDAAFSGWSERGRRVSGPFLIRLLDNPSAESARMRLIDRINPPHLAVFEGSRNRERACAFTATGRVLTGGLGGDPTMPAQRFMCPSGEPYVVAVTTIDDERFEPRRCIWAHPSPYGALTLRFRDVWLGQKLVGHGGLPWLISRDGVGTPVHLAARFEGESIGEATIEDTRGWSRFEWSTVAVRDRHGELEIVVSSERSENRRFCFTLESR